MTKAKAKSKDKKSKKNTEMPKSVAGVKVPKSVRKSGSLSTLFNSELGREILADALIAAAGAAAAALTRTRTAKETGKAVADAGAQAASGTSDAVQTAAGAVATVVGEAAKTFLPASLLGDNEDKTPAKAAKPRYVNLASDHGSRKKSVRGPDKTSKR